MSTFTLFYHIIKQITSTKCQKGRFIMFKNKAKNGKNNICGKNIALIRTNSDYSQNDIANKLQLIGIDLDKNAVQRIESGERFVTDIELKALAEIFNTTTEELLK